MPGSAKPFPSIEVPAGVLPTDPSPNNDPSRSTQLGIVALGLGLIGVLAAAGVLLWSGVTTASARISGSTANESSLFVASVIELSVESGSDAASAELLVDADGLYPGLAVERCLVLTYHGTLADVPVRLYGRQAGGTGLDRFLQTEIELGTGASPECSDFRPVTTAFNGQLADLWAQHPSFADGIDLMPAADDGQSVTVRFSVEVESDNDAQGLTTDFWVVVEARP